MNVLLAAAQAKLPPGPPLLPGASPAGAASPLPAQPTVPQAPVTLGPVKSPLAEHAPWLTHTLAAFFVLFAVLLVFLLAIQTTKQEGLQGTIGGRVESSYRGRIGGDAMLARFTNWVAFCFGFFALAISITGI